jgi:hypothetical protein
MVKPVILLDSQPRILWVWLHMAALILPKVLLILFLTVLLCSCLEQAFFFFWNRVSLCIPAWTRTNDPPAESLVSWVLGLHVCVTMFSLNMHFWELVLGLVLDEASGVTQRNRKSFSAVWSIISVSWKDGGAYNSKIMEPRMIGLARCGECTPYSPST